jgi:hypothetical protein
MHSVEQVQSDGCRSRGSITGLELVCLGAERNGASGDRMRALIGR